MNLFMGMTNILLYLLIPLLFSYNQIYQTPETAPTEITLNVALYPYVPRLAQFQTELAKQWQTVAPEGVSYQLISWDAYSTDPPADLDVFVFDAIFFDYFHRKGYLKNITVTDQQKADIIPFFLDGGKVGDVQFGLPQLGCANLLFYRRQDQELAQVTSLAELETVLGDATYSTAKPPKDVGLIADLSGGTTDSCLYVETRLDLTGQYTTHPVLPPSDQLNQTALNNLHQVVCMAGKPGASYESNTSYERAGWFGEGFGRALVGFSESMSEMANPEKVAFKLFPLASPDRLNLFYTDLVSINAQIPKNKTDAAQVMAELLSSAWFFNNISQPTDGDPSPQYLMPVHHSSFKALQAQFPLYGEMYNIVRSPNCHVLRLGNRSREWLTQNKAAIEDLVLGANCVN